ncbi:hypothetical protein PsorP6_015623 [Peronosclerospora sorghi]|uniref:Uncharacterized protein n=1 Tax=Peronosclerospora sorghi TaxID=230839 RepID=A0ACC0WPF9_9STRA|nr:hypothetical protein PsorP6_015623 [Peronosclerospora sorghi]
MQRSLRASAVRMEYNESPKERYQHLREINRILKHWHVPKSIKKALQNKREASARDQKKMANHRAHAKEGALSHTNIREKVVVKEMEENLLHFRLTDTKLLLESPSGSFMLVLSWRRITGVLRPSTLGPVYLLHFVKD